MFEITKLKYSFDALEPVIDRQTMEIHYSKHHQTYVDKLNGLASGTEWENWPIETILARLEQIEEGKRMGVRNNGGGVYNHDLWWQSLKLNQTMGLRLREMVKASYGDEEGLKKELVTSGLNRFGSGWVWLVSDQKRLKIFSTPNQDNPLMQEVKQDQKLSEASKILLGIDVWEHAYYLKYQNRRQEYLEKVLLVIDWDAVEKRLE